MARMLPTTVRGGTSSPAEHEMFTRIRDELSNDWIALHSLGLTIHRVKPWAEIDFVLIGPPGVICLEVKGGLISRRNGIWYTTPQRGRHAGQQRRLHESPFEQVGSASAQLFRFIQRACPSAAKAITGYAIAAPDVDWTAKGPDIDLALIYDQNDRAKTFADFMDRVFRRWNERIGGSARKPETLNRHAKQAVLESIRGDFYLVPSLQASAQAADRELVRLTDEQCQLFARLSANPRVVARGGAGTGKTLIAAEEARRLARRGQKVLYVCFSRNLARYLAGVLADVPAITVRTLHSLMNELVSTAGRRSELPEVEESDLFAVFLPELALDVLLDSDDAGRFTAVIIDEAQDLLREPYLDVIDALIEGELKDGTWRCFIDASQNIVGGIAPTALRRLQAAAPVEWPLTVNCRNTQPIAVQVALLSGAPMREVLAPDGPAAELVWYTSADDQRSAASERLRRLRHEGFDARQITVLSRFRLERSVAHDGLGMPLKDISRGGLGSLDDQIAFSTVSSFKGLEAEVVLLVDVDDLSSAEGLTSVYVGASRARVALYVFISDRVRDQFREHALVFGRQVMERSASPKLS
jgi:Nuclease-related domain/AAA domain